MTIEEFGKKFNEQEEWIVNLIKYWNDHNPFTIIRNNDCSDVIVDLYLTYYNSGLYENIEYKDTDHFRASLTITLKNIFTRSGGSYVYERVGSKYVNSTISSDDLPENIKDEIYIDSIEEDDIDFGREALDKWLSYSSYNRRFFEIYLESGSLRALSERLRISIWSSRLMVNRMKEEIYLVSLNKYKYSDIIRIMDIKYVRRKNKN